MSAPAERFDAAYYQRFYHNPETRAASPAEQQHQAVFIASYLKYLQLPVTRILDVGCGLGALLHHIGGQFPRAECVGVELSPYLCETYGWQNGSVVDYEDDAFDLVICSDVLGYLNNRDCGKALKNLARLCEGALYLSVITAEDLDICDPEHTDMQQKSRPHSWYQQRLAVHFAAMGGGLFLRKPLSVPVWRMEQA